MCTKINQLRKEERKKNKNIFLHNTNILYIHVNILLQFKLIGKGITHESRKANNLIMFNSNTTNNKNNNSVDNNNYIALIVIIIIITFRRKH